MPGLFGARARSADDAHQRQARVARLQRIPAQAELGQGRGAKGGDEHVAALQLGVQYRLAFGGFQVSLQYTHALVHLGVCLCAVHRHGVGAGVAGGCGGLQLGALGAHVAAAQQGGRAWQVEGQAENAGLGKGLEGLE